MAKRLKSASRSPSTISGSSDIDTFLAAAARIPVRADGSKGRLIFALDATLSRQPTWDRACALQAEMFSEAAAGDGLEVQMVYFRGFGEFYASPWHKDADSLLAAMSEVTCRGGQTQIEKVLRHASAETKKKPVNALVYVGDCVEEEIDRLSRFAGELGLLNVPAFVFQEHHEPYAREVFKEIARLTKGAHCQFDSASARQLRELLRAVAAYAAGGRKALQNYGRGAGHEVQTLIAQLGR